MIANRLQQIRLRILSHKRVPSHDPLIHRSVYLDDVTYLMALFGEARAYLDAMQNGALEDADYPLIDVLLANTDEHIDDDDR